MLGLPTYGLELKLAPTLGKLEARVRGPNVMPGYFRQPELSAQAFDEEGFYRFGDALKFVDEREPLRGLYFDGRIAEDFKLSTGTWVSVGPLKAQLVQRAAPYLQEAVLAGHDREEVSALLFPDVAACRALCPELPAEANAEQVLASAGVRAWLQGVLDAQVAESTGSSNRVVRALLLTAPPSSDKHEITDKGSINQRAVLENRAELVEALYREPYPELVIRARRVITV
jgi:feruloyl-CoA synthase